MTGNLTSVPNKILYLSRPANAKLARQSLKRIARKVAINSGEIFNAPMPGTPLYITIADVIARVFAAFAVDELNRLALPKLAEDRVLIGLEDDEFQVLVDAHYDDFKAGRPDDGVVRRALILHWIGCGLTEPEAERKAAGQVAAMEQQIEARLRARPDGWVRSPPPPPRLRRDDVEVELGEMINQELHRGRINIAHPSADLTSMLPVVVSSMLQLRQTFPEGQWVLARRDRNPDPQLIVEPHTDEAGFAVLMDAVRSRLGIMPELWPLHLTPAELEERLKILDISPERWTDVSTRYRARLEPLTEPPKLEVSNKGDHPLTDREWGKRERINQKTELPLLREVYIGRRKKPRKA